VVDAIEALPPDDGPPDAPGVGDEVWAALGDELGDLLFQVVFHAILAEEEQAFSTADVAQGIHDKLVRRHPHVFGEVEVGSAGDVVRNWEQIKKGERNSESLVDSVPVSLPALLYAHKLFRKAASVGLDPGDERVAVARIEAALPGVGGADADHALGEILAAAVALARAQGVDAESALRGWTARYQNYSQWDNRSASEYLEQARVTADPELRKRLYRNFQVVFSKELPSLPLYVPVYSYGVDSQVQGVQVGALYDPSDRLNTFANWYLLTRRALEQTNVPTANP
ncbi:MAG: MazG nucleotide pyrophosphohydrolase domain-containing protein, partial [Bacteroidota bacterium]